MTAQAAYYANVGASECLACSHPAEWTPSIEQLADALRTMGSEERTAWYDARDAPPETGIAIEEDLRDPGCAQVRAGRRGDAGDAAAAMPLARSRSGSSVGQPAICVVPPGGGPGCELREEETKLRWE